MATRTVVCPECDAPLAPGRFACAACGALLATVASGSRSLFPAAAPADAPAALTEEPDAVVPEASVAVSHEMPVATPAVAPVATPAVAPIATPAATPAATPVALSGAVPTSAAAPTSGAARTASPSAPAPQAGAPAWPDQSAWTPAPSSSGPSDHTPPVAGPPTVPADSLRNPAGAYLPPSAVLPPAEALPLPTAKAATPARPAHSGLAESVGSLTLPSDPVAAVISIGAGVSAIGFLLPWADVVLGSSGMGSFLDRWGLAGPGHLVVFALLLGLAGLAAFSHRLPRQVRPGLPAVGLGFLLVGLAWPYLFGPFGATAGVYVITAGGLVLAIAGTIELLLRRHAGPVASV